MWKWTIKFDKAFEIPTYRVKADGFIVGTIRQFDQVWSWDLTLPLQAVPDWCKGTQPTREQFQDAIRDAIEALTKGLNREDALRVLLQGITGRQ